MMEYSPNICKARFDSQCCQGEGSGCTGNNIKLLLWLFFPPGAGSCSSGSWEENDKIVSRKLQIHRWPVSEQSCRVEMIEFSRIELTE